MKAMFIICPSLGIGEIFTCIKLGEQLSKANIEIYYLGTEAMYAFTHIRSKAHALFTTNIEENHKLIHRIINEFKPDFFVFTDYNMYIRSLELRKLFDFEFLAGFDIPALVIDTLGNCRFDNRNTSIFEDENINITLPKHVCGILRPVPQHDPKNADDESKVRYFSVFNKQDLSPNVDRKILKQMLGLDSDKKVVLLTLGHWVKKVTTVMEYRLYLNLIRVVFHYLNNLGIPLEVCILGESAFEFNEFRNISINKKYNELSFQETDNLIKSSDLVITLNRFSNSLCRSSFFQIPSITLINSNDIEVTGNNQIKGIHYNVSDYNMKIMRLVTHQRGIIKKYMIFPESRTDTFERFFRVNSCYANIIHTIEVFDEESAVKAMRKYLMDNDDSLREARSEFIERAFSLAPSVNLIKELVYGKCIGSV